MPSVPKEKYAWVKQIIREGIYRRLFKNTACVEVWSGRLTIRDTENEIQETGSNSNGTSLY